MRLLISTFGSSGDVFPFLGLALELRSRGHEITFATNDHFRALIQRHGIAFEPIGSAEQFDEALQHPDLWEPGRAFAHVFQFLKPAQEIQFDLFANFARTGGVGIANLLSLGARLAQDKFGLPLITVDLQPSVVWSDVSPPTLPGLFGPNWLKSWIFRLAQWLVIDPTALPYLNTWRKKLGLTPIRHLMEWWHSPLGTVCLFPNWFAPAQPDWPRPLVQTDFPLWNDGSDAALPAEVVSFLERGTPPIVFTPGSANIHGRDFFQASVAACLRLQRRAILLTKYPQQLPESLPESIAHLAYIPLDTLLRHCAAFVHHGGIGSMSQGLLAGLPQLLMPLAHDQFDNAARVEKLGVGRSLTVRRFTTTNVARELNTLATSPQVATRCREVAARLSPRDGLKRAADAVESLASIRADRVG